jgi:PAS domain S-box-containing protein
MDEACSILIVEDERIVAQDLQETLNALGYDAFAVASTGEEALAKAQVRRPDLALLDIRIRGDLDGIDTAKRLGERFGVPVIYLTAHADDATIERAKVTQPQGYLLKPVKTGELRSAIELSRHRVALELRAREAEAALRASEARYRLIVETAREGICITDAEGRFAYANRRMEALLGYEPGGLLGKHFLEIMDAEAGERAKATHAGRRQGKSEGWECKIQHRDGHDVWVWAESSPILSEDGFQGSLAMVTDVTEQKLAQRAKEDLRERMIVADRLASIGLLAAGVGHEINNPLTFILANLDIVARGVPREAPRLGRMVDEIRKGAERIRRVVKGLKTFARVEEGPRAVIDVAAIVESSIDVAENEIRHRARIVKEYGPAPPVEADEARLGQALLNLLVNAAHAIPEGHADTNEIRVVTGKDPEGRAFIEIRDTGRGIPPPARGRVFEPFAMMNDVGAGTGLGLAVCHAIVTSLGGEVTFESEVGKGSAFRVVLPPASAQAVSARPAPAPAPAPIEARRRGRILIIDDDELVGQALSLLVGDHDVTLATNGKEALELIESGAAFDLIFCDLMMPVMTGMDLHAALAAKGSRAVERMVFVTGGAFTPGAREFLAAIPNRMLEKPFDLDAIRTTVLAHVARAPN